MLSAKRRSLSSRATLALFALALSTAACGARSGLIGPELTDAVDARADATLDARADVPADIPADVPADVPQCVLGATRACYSGPVATRGVGSCMDGVQT